MTRLLFIDASLHGALTAIFAVQGQGSRLLASRSHPSHAGATQSMGELVRGALAASGSTLDDMQGLILGNGPGSFTGIRVGLAYGYGLLAGRRALGGEVFPVWGVSALAAAAWSLADASTTSTSLVLPATKTHGFVAEGRPGQSARNITPSLIDLSAVAGSGASALQNPFAGEEVLLASPWPIAEQYLVQSQHQVRVLGHDDLIQHALRGIVSMIGRAWPRESASELPGPVYLRLSTPEERLGIAAQSTSKPMGVSQ